MEISESSVSTICPLERGAHNAEVSVEGGSTVFSYIYPAPRMRERG